MERAQRDNKTIGSVIAPVELLSDFRNWPEVSYDYLFINQSQDKPEKPAVVFGEDVLTYRELELQSRQWAYWLLSKGIKRGGKVLVCMERALELPAVLLGILRAGACYVPADPAFPPDRIAVIFEDSDSAAVISDRQNEGLLPPNNPSVHFVVEDKPSQLEAQTLPEWNPDDLAYLIFTSGSTGRPKGVPITRAAMMNFLLAMADKPGIASEDRVLALTTISFDISVLELFLPLIAGATVYVVSKRDSLDPQSLSRIIDEHRLTLMQATPATWRLLYDYGWRPKRHQKLLCGGEAFPVNLANELFVCAGEVWNMYGPTEATVWSSCHQISETDLDIGKIPLGQPLPNIEYLVCDNSGNPVAENGTGELWIGGIALTPGYYRRPDLNLDRFVSGEFLGKTQRFYRTGDLVSLQSNGEFVYLDRLDNQVKIRGHRIELGEIEAVLRRIEGVQDAKVIKADDDINEPVLVGCIRPKQAPDDDSLVRMLSSTLPNYMIPTVWFRVDEFPETPNRKVDRRKLRDSLPKNLLQANPGLDTVPVEMSGLAKLWEQVLGRAPAHAKATFLSMGGHSLSAARLSVLVERDYKCWIEPVQFLATPHLFEHWNLIQLQISDKPGARNQKPPGSQLAQVASVIPVSSAQESMWYSGVLHGTQSVYNESEALLLEGRLDQKVLSEALKTLQSRHVAFRMFPEISGGKLIGWKTNQTPRGIALTVFSRETEDSTREDILSEESRKEFSFSPTEPLIRFVLHRFPSGDALQFIAHHTIIDGLSEKRLWSDLAQIYGEVETGHPPDDEALNEDVFEKYLRAPARHHQQDLAYWRSIFREMPPYLEVKADNPRPPEFSQECIQTGLSLGRSGYRRLNEYAKGTNSTPFQILLAVFFVWLDRYSQQGDYVVGVPVSGRESGIAEKAIGLFMNTVPVREKVTGSETFSTFLSRARKTTIEAISHGRVPFGVLVNSVNPGRDVGRTPLYQSIFSFNDEQGLPEAIGTINCLEGPLMVDTGYGPTELTMFADYDAEGLSLRLKGSAGLFRQETLSRMAHHFRELLISAISAPETPVANLNMLSEEDLDIISAANETKTSYPRDGSIVSCFSAEVSSNPDSPAVEFGDQCWTYRQLAARAASITETLLEQGVLRGDPVGVIASRHPDTIAALIGILQAGASYVPLDSGFPAKRLEQMILQSGTKIVLVHSLQKSVKEAFPDVCRLVQIEPHSSTPVSSSFPRIEPTERAYIMFTSGSTGDPKGIEVAHRNVLRLVKNTDFMQLDSETRFLMNSPVPFDASTLEIWGPLLNGGTLVIPEQERLTTRDMERILSAKNVNSVFLTTTLFHYFAEEAAGIFDSLRYLLTGGEVLSPVFAKKVLKRNPGLILVNGYGPTENTTFTCCLSMSDADKVRVPVPIGKPIANTRVHILDPNGQRCPIGIPGELYAGGDGVALGYINRPDLTEQVFKVLEHYDPERVYRTGDLARWLGDGTIEFLGRADNQVKIRGFRIEPEEVTLKVVGSGLADHAFTMPWRAPSGEQQLVCYFVRSNEAPCVRANEAINEVLHGSLPAYMVPTHIIEVDRLPTGPTGKIDKSLLPKPIVKQSELPLQGTTEFQGECEQKLAEIWRDVLGRADFGRDDDFFVLGGSSLKALEVFSRIEKTFGVNLPLAVLLKTSTIRALAEQINVLSDPQTDNSDSYHPQTHWNSLVTLVDKKTELSPIICVHAVGGNVLSYRGLRHFRDVNRPVVGFQSRGLDGVLKPQETIDQMAADYVDELLAAGFRGTFTLMGGSMGGNIALEMAHRLKLLGHDVDWVILLDTVGPHAREYPDYFPDPSIVRRAIESIRARGIYYGKALVTRIHRAIGRELPYQLRPFWVEESNKKALYAHRDKSYSGDVLLIRAPEGRGPVYTVPSLGWEGVLLGKVLTEFVDVEHNSFMESEAVQDILQRFFAEIESHNTDKANENA